MKLHQSNVGFLFMLLISIVVAYSMPTSIDNSKRGELFGKRFDPNSIDVANLNDDDNELEDSDGNNIIAQQLTKRARERNSLLTSTTANIGDRRLSDRKAASQLLQNLLLEIVNQRDRRGRGNELFG